MMILIVILLAAILFVLIFGREIFLSILSLGGVLLLVVAGLGIRTVVIMLIVEKAGQLLPDFEDAPGSIFELAIFGLAIYALYEIIRNKLQDYSKKRMDKSGQL